MNDLDALESRVTRITEMRELLLFLESNPEIPMPYFGQMNAFGYKEDGDVDTLARVMAPCSKEINGGYFSLVRDFGSIELAVNFDREEVCERIVVGTEKVPAKVIEEYTKEIVEWRCPDGVLRRSDT